MQVVRQLTSLALCVDRRVPIILVSCSAIWLILTSASLVRLETRVEADTREIKVEVRELNAEFGQLRTDLTARLDAHRAAQREETASLEEEIRSIRTDVIELLTELAVE